MILTKTIYPKQNRTPYGVYPCKVTIEFEWWEFFVTPFYTIRLIGRYLLSK